MEAMARQARPWLTGTKSRIRHQKLLNYQYAMAGGATLLAGTKVAITGLTGAHALRVSWS